MTAEQGTDIARRMQAARITAHMLHRHTGIDRKTLQRAIEGRGSVRASTYGAIEKGLTELEAPFAANAPVEQVTFRLTGSFGVRFEVQGPVTHLAELEASAARVMAELLHGDTPTEAGVQADAPEARPER